MGRRRRVVAAVVSVTVLTAFALGWVAAGRFVSPAQKEAAARPPAALPVFAKVAEGELVDRAEARGTVESSLQQHLRPLALPANAVVTAVHARRDGQLHNGSLLLSLNGAPVIVVASPFPFYRDLSPGLVGPDVHQLQAALRDAGYDVPRSEDAQFGVATQQAVRSLTAGLDASTPSSNGGLALSQVVTARSVPGTVRRILALGASVGSGDALAILESGSLLIRAPFTSAAAANMAPGQDGVVSLPNGKTEPVRVVRLLGPQTQAGGTTQVLLAPVRSRIPIERGSSVLVSVTLKVITGRGLIVPTRAVAGSSAQDVRVLRREGERLETVSVEVLGTLNGSTAIRCREPGSLKPGDLVQVG